MQMNLQMKFGKIDPDIMKTQISIPSPQYQPVVARISPILQTLATMFIGFCLLALFIVLIPVGYDFNYRDRIFPGVSVSGKNLSGLSPAQAAVQLTQVNRYPETGKIVFQYGQQVWVATPAQLGLSQDVQTAVQAAFLVGRNGGFLTRLSQQFQAYSSGFSLPAVFTWDERIAYQYLAAIAAQVDLPIIEASVQVNGVEVEVRSGQVGRKMDISQAMSELRTQLSTFTDGIIPVVVNETPPVILDASQQAEIARRILSAPLEITVAEPAEGDPGPWTFQPAELAAMLVIERVEDAQGGRYQVGLETASLQRFLQEIAPAFVRFPVNARFIFNDDTRQLELIQPAVIGRTLNVTASLQKIKEKVIAGEHAISLEMESSPPPVSDESTAESLGIRELVNSYSSYFYGSSNERIQNIQTASARFHGLLVPPGASFSMADALGDVSLDNGYAEALIILGDRTIKGVGGGVCQVSTTLFRTAFFGGFPIVERHPHAYRVGYYEQTASGGHDANLAGLDATVFVPVVDFVFINDTSNWLLMETYVNVNGRRLTWKFYSTSDGRQVNWTTTGPQNVVEPPEPLYEENPSLSQGTIKQVDWEAEGADITVERTVTRGDQIILQDTFITHYLPWRAVYQYGPGTEIPTPEPEEGGD
jgi:vancomycin resistance protein YoaR